MPKVFVYFRNFKKLTNFFLSLVVFQKNWQVQSGGFSLIQLLLVNSDSPHQKTVRWVDSLTQAHGSWTSLLQALFGLLPGSKEFSLGLLVFDSFPWSVLKEYSVPYSLLYWRRPRSVTFLFGCMQADSSSTCLQFSVPFPYVFFLFRLLRLSLFNFCAFAATLCWFWEQSSKMSGPLNLGLLGKSKYLKNIFALRF